MIITRRRVLEVGGGYFVALLLAPSPGLAAEPIDIVMKGTSDGSHVWFDPIGLHIQPGQVVRWTNRDPGNSHTVTAYHPTNFDRPRRIPEAATAWDSDYLLPEQSFSFTFVEEGVYDYYCVPHEHAGMVGRIVVGNPPAIEPNYTAEANLTPAPAVALANLPAVADILARGVVHPART